MRERQAENRSAGFSNPQYAGMIVIGSVVFLALIRVGFRGHVG